MLNLFKLLCKTKVIVRRDITIIEYKALRIEITDQDVVVKSKQDMILDYERFMSIKPPTGFDPAEELKRLKEDARDQPETQPCCQDKRRLRN